MAGPQGRAPLHGPSPPAPPGRQETHAYFADRPRAALRAAIRPGRARGPRDAPPGRASPHRPERPRAVAWAVDTAGPGTADPPGGEVGGKGGRRRQVPRSRGPPGRRGPGPLQRRGVCGGWGRRGWGLGPRFSTCERSDISQRDRARADLAAAVSHTPATPWTRSWPAMPGGRWTGRAGSLAPQLHQVDAHTRRPAGGRPAPGGRESRLAAPVGGGKAVPTK